MIRVIVRVLDRASRSLLFYATCAALLTAAAVILSLLGAAPRPGPAAPGVGRVAALSAAASGRYRGWGEEAAEASHGPLTAWSPIAAANACGMGASSCFKCHNSGRGPAISASAWHTDHEQVNNDCVGCHQGSPYLLKKSLAHAGMIANPLTAPDKTCATCHQGRDLSKLVATYAKAGAPQPK